MAGRIRTVLEMIKFEHSVFALPFALIPLLLLTGNRKVMGEFINRPTTHWLGWLTVSIVIGLNLFLLWQTFTA